MLLIEFFEPPISLSLREYMAVSDTMSEISSSAGDGKEFFAKGVGEIDQNIVPLFSESGYGRLVPSYSMLYWFTLQVSKTTVRWFNTLLCMLDS